LADASPVDALILGPFTCAATAAASVVSAHHPFAHGLAHAGSLHALVLRAGAFPADVATPVVAARLGFTVRLAAGILETDGTRVAADLLAIEAVRGTVTQAVVPALGVVSARPANIAAPILSALPVLALRCAEQDAESLLAFVGLLVARPAASFTAVIAAFQAVAVRFAGRDAKSFPAHGAVRGAYPADSAAAIVSAFQPLAVGRARVALFATEAEECCAGQQQHGDGNRQVP